MKISSDATPGNLAARARRAQRFQRLRLLAYWPLFGVLFYILERVCVRRVFFPMHCALDEHIPFCEYFLIPYLFWFVFLIGIHVYTFFYEPEAFEKLMRFIIISYSISLLIFFLFPTCQNLRPASFERDNFLTHFIAGFYQFDTNTNVCPSLHVVGSVAVMLCAWDTRRFSTGPWRLAFGVTALLISISTVFLKQHSVLDIMVALPVCAVSYSVAYGKWELRRSRVPLRGTV